MTKTKLAVAGLFLCMAASLCTADASKKIYAVRAEKAFLAAQTQFQSATNNTTNA